MGMSSNTQVFPDNVLKPDGSDTVFTKGTYRGRSFYDVLVEDPRQFTILRNAKNLSKELHSFVTWADQHFNVNNDGVIEEKADWVTVPCIGVCTDVRHKGSSAGFIRATCKKCGTATQVERNKPFLDPEVCPHANVDHRGSSRSMRKTFCRDCGVYTDVISRELHESLERVRQALVTASYDETQVLGKAMTTTPISAEVIKKASAFLNQDVAALEPGMYKVSDTVNMWLDCLDRAQQAATVSQPTAMMAWKAWNAWSEMPETQNTKLRVVDPLEDEGIDAIIDDACNTCCHGELWRENAEKKLAALGFKPFWVNGGSTNFNGIGKKATSGKVKLPFGIELVGSGMIIPGAVSTHEVPKASRPHASFPGLSSQDGHDQEHEGRNNLPRRLRPTLGSCTPSWNRSLHDPHRPLAHEGLSVAWGRTLPRYTGKITEDGISESRTRLQCRVL